MFFLNMKLKAEEQEKKMNAQQNSLTGLLRDLSQISPSLNKHKGVFGRQLHFMSRERQA